MVEGTRCIDTETTTSWPIRSLLRANWLATLFNTYMYYLMHRMWGVAPALVRVDDLSSYRGCPADAHRFPVHPIISHTTYVTILYCSPTNSIQFRIIVIVEQSIATEEKLKKVLSLMGSFKLYIRRSLFYKKRINLFYMTNLLYTKHGRRVRLGRVYPRVEFRLWCFQLDERKIAFLEVLHFFRHNFFLVHF